MALVCLFTVNDLSWAAPSLNYNPSKSTLAPRTRLAEPEFKEIFKAREFLLSHEALNRYIKDQIEKEIKILGREKWEEQKTLKWSLRMGGAGGKARSLGIPLPTIRMVSITGLLRHTGQFAHVGLSGKDYDGTPVLYIDSQFYNRPSSPFNAIPRHETDEIAQWENLRLNILSDKYGHEIGRSQMRQWIKDHIDSPDEKLKRTPYESLTSRQIAKKFHKDSYPLDALYAEYADKADFNYEYINLMLSLYGTDEESKDVNIAAGQDEIKNTALAGADTLTRMITKDFNSLAPDQIGLVDRLVAILSKAPRKARYRVHDRDFRDYDNCLGWKKISSELPDDLVSTKSCEIIKCGRQKEDAFSDFTRDVSSYRNTLPAVKRRKDGDAGNGTIGYVLRPLSQPILQKRLLLPDIHKNINFTVLGILMVHPEVYDTQSRPCHLDMLFALSSADGEIIRKILSQFPDALYYAIANRNIAPDKPNFMEGEDRIFQGVSKLYIDPLRTHAPGLGPNYFIPVDLANSNEVETLSRTIVFYDAQQAKGKSPTIAAPPAAEKPRSLSAARAGFNPKKDLKEGILEYLRSQGPKTTEGIIEWLGHGQNTEPEIKTALKALVKEGRILLRDGAYMINPNAIPAAPPATFLYVKPQGRDLIEIYKNGRIKRAITAGGNTLKQLLEEWLAGETEWGCREAINFALSRLNSKIGSLDAKSAIDLFPIDEIKRHMPDSSSASFEVEERMDGTVYIPQVPPMASFGLTHGGKFIAHISLSQEKNACHFDISLTEDLQRKGIGTYWIKNILIPYFKKLGVRTLYGYRRCDEGPYAQFLASIGFTNEVQISDDGYTETYRLEKDISEGGVISQSATGPVTPTGRPAQLLDEMRKMKDIFSASGAKTSRELSKNKMRGGKGDSRRTIQREIGVLCDLVLVVHTGRKYHLAPWLEGLDDDGWAKLLADEGLNKASPREKDLKQTRELISVLESSVKKSTKSDVSAKTALPALHVFKEAANLAFAQELSIKGINDGLPQQLLEKIDAGIERVVVEDMVLNISKIIMDQASHWQKITTIVDVKNRKVTIPVNGRNESFDIAETCKPGETKIENLEIYFGRNSQRTKRKLLDVLVELELVPEWIKGSNFAIEYPFNIVKNRTTSQLRIIWGSNNKELRFYPKGFAAILSDHESRRIRDNLVVPQSMQDDEEFILSGHNHGVCTGNNIVLPSEKDITTQAKNAQQVWLRNFATEDTIMRLRGPICLEKIEKILSSRKGKKELIEFDENIIGKFKNGGYGFARIRSSITPYKIKIVVQIFNFETNKWEDLTVIFDGNPEIVTTLTWQHIYKDIDSAVNKVDASKFISIASSKATAPPAAEKPRSLSAARAGFNPEKDLKEGILEYLKSQGPKTTEEIIGWLGHGQNTEPEIKTALRALVKEGRILLRDGTYMINPNAVPAAPPATLAKPSKDNNQRVSSQNARELERHYRAYQLSLEYAADLRNDQRYQYPEGYRQPGSNIQSLSYLATIMFTDIPLRDIDKQVLQALMELFKRYGFEERDLKYIYQVVEKHKLEGSIGRNAPVGWFLPDEIHAEEAIKKVSGLTVEQRRIIASQSWAPLARKELPPAQGIGKFEICRYAPQSNTPIQKLEKQIIDIYENLRLIYKRESIAERIKSYKGQLPQVVESGEWKKDCRWVAMQMLTHGFNPLNLADVGFVEGKIREYEYSDKNLKRLYYEIIAARARLLRFETLLKGLIDPAPLLDLDKIIELTEWIKRQARPELENLEMYYQTVTGKNYVQDDRWENLVAAQLAAYEGEKYDGRTACGISPIVAETIGRSISRLPSIDKAKQALKLRDVDAVRTELTHLLEALEELLSASKRRNADELWWHYIFPLRMALLITQEAKNANGDAAQKKTLPATAPPAAEKPRSLGAAEWERANLKDTAPDGSLYRVFEHFCKNDIMTAKKALTGRKIAKKLGRSYDHTIYRDISALDHLGLIDTEDRDTESRRPGKHARWFVSASVKKKLEEDKKVGKEDTETELLTLLAEFRFDILRPSRKVLAAYLPRIEKILNETGSAGMAQKELSPPARKLRLLTEKIWVSTTQPDEAGDYWYRKKYLIPLLEHTARDVEATNEAAIDFSKKTKRPVFVVGVERTGALYTCAMDKWWWQLKDKCDKDRFYDQAKMLVGERGISERTAQLIIAQQWIDNGKIDWYVDTIQHWFPSNPDVVTANGATGYNYFVEDWNDEISKTTANLMFVDESINRKADGLMRSISDSFRFSHPSSFDYIRRYILSKIKRNDGRRKVYYINKGEFKKANLSHEDFSVIFYRPGTPIPSYLVGKFPYSGTRLQGEEKIDIAWFDDVDEIIGVCEQMDALDDPPMVRTSNGQMPLHIFVKRMLRESSGWYKRKAASALRDNGTTAPAGPAGARVSPSRMAPETPETGTKLGSPLAIFELLRKKKGFVRAVDIGKETHLSLRWTVLRDLNTLHYLGLAEKKSKGTESKYEAVNLSPPKYEKIKPILKSLGARPSSAQKENAKKRIAAILKISPPYLLSRRGKVGARLRKQFESYYGMVYYPAAGDDLNSAEYLRELFPNATIRLNDAFIKNELVHGKLRSNSSLDNVMLFLKEQFEESAYVKSAAISIINRKEKLLQVTIMYKQHGRYSNKRPPLRFEYEVGKLEDSKIRAGVVFVKVAGWEGRLEETKKFWRKIHALITPGGYLLRAHLVIGEDSTTKDSTKRTPSEFFTCLISPLLMDEDDFNRVDIFKRKREKSAPAGPAGARVSPSRMAPETGTTPAIKKTTRRTHRFRESIDTQEVCASNSQKRMGASIRRKLEKLGMLQRSPNKKEHRVIIIGGHLNNCIRSAIQFEIEEERRRWTEVLLPLDLIYLDSKQENPKEKLELKKSYIWESKNKITDYYRELDKAGINYVVYLDNVRARSRVHHPKTARTLYIRWFTNHKKMFEYIAKSATLTVQVQSEDRLQVGTKTKQKFKGGMASPAGWAEKARKLSAGELARQYCMALEDGAADPIEWIQEALANNPKKFAAFKQKVKKTRRSLRKHPAPASPAAVVPEVEQRKVNEYDLTVDVRTIGLMQVFHRLAAGAAEKYRFAQAGTPLGNF